MAAPDLKELRRELDVTKEKLRRMEDSTLAERRRDHELLRADSESRGPAGPVAPF